MLRRLRGRGRPDAGLGAAVLLRHTLRLLTLDQLGRAATLVCALEQLRRAQPVRLGDVRFAVGLWVGKSATANTMGEITARLDEYRTSQAKQPASPLHRDRRRCAAPSLRLLEGATGDFSEVVVRCACGAWAPLSAAQVKDANPTCSGRRPWVGPDADEECAERQRLLVRTASNAYFSQVMSALSVPEHGREFEHTVREHWAFLKKATAATLPAAKELSDDVRVALAPYPDATVLRVIEALRDERPLPRDELRTAEGEGVLIALDEAAVVAWEQRPEVQARQRALRAGYDEWASALASAPEFPGGRFCLLHSLEHLLISAIALECGYAASALRERIYCAAADAAVPMAGILISTGTPGSEGTLGGQVERGRRIATHLRRADDLGVPRSTPAWWRRCRRRRGSRTRAACDIGGGRHAAPRSALASAGRRC